MRKGCKILLFILYCLVGTLIIIGCYLLLERFFPAPWPALICTAIIFIINMTLGRYLRRLFFE